MRPWMVMVTVITQLHPAKESSEPTVPNTITYITSTHLLSIGESSEVTKGQPQPVLSEIGK